MTHSVTFNAIALGENTHSQYKAHVVRLQTTYMPISAKRRQ